MPQHGNDPNLDATVLVPKPAAVADAAGGDRARRLADRPQPPTPDTPAPPEDETLVDYRPLAVRGQSLRTPGIPGYEVLERLGRGGMGVVYKARHLRLKRIVALKMILAAEHAGPQELARFRREAEAAARLQHPNIVQVFEVGEHEGRPWIAQEFVPGGSLAERLNGAPQPPREAARLVRTLAAAIAHAHEQGVVHRDLKPANVLLAQSDQRSAFSFQLEEDAQTVDSPQPSTLDETISPDAENLKAESCLLKADSSLPKIADFGLAKQLDADDDSAGLTRTGDVMGTPSYMAPEQAAGDGAAIGPAADVYALGAILYELLTGRPPFRGATALETLDQLRTQEPLPPSRLLPKLPRDVETICLKCLQKDAAKRYGSAQALADDLGAFLDDRPIQARPVGRLERSWRWCKRNPAVASLTTIAAALFVAVATVSIVLAVQSDNALRDSQRAAKDLADERDAKDRERKDAIAAQDRAREMIETISSREGLDQLSRQQKLTPDQRTLLERMVTYYREYAAEAATTETERLRQYLAYYNMGRMHFLLGRPKEAARAYAEAIRVVERLIADYPSNPKYAAARAARLNDLGMLGAMTQDFPTAEKYLQQAISEFERLEAQHPEQPDHRHDLAKVYRVVGNLRGLQGRADEALDAYEFARTRLERLALDQPQRRDYVYALASVYDAMSWLRAEMGDPAKGRKSAEAALGLYQKLTELDPHEVDFQFGLGTAHGRLADFLDQSGDPQAALSHLEAAGLIFSRLVLEQPAMHDIAAHFGQTQNRLGSVLEQMGDFTRAHQAFQASVRIRERLTREYPELADYARDLALTQKNLGEFLQRRQELDTARVAFEAAVSVQKTLAAAHPDDSRYVKHLPLMHRRLANLLHLQGELDEARQAYEAAQACLDRLIKMSPDDDDHPYDLASTYNSLGMVLHDLQDWPAARRMHGAALELRQRFLRDLPDDPDYQLDVGGSLCNLAAVLRDSGQLEEALASYQESIAILEPLAKQHPSSVSPKQFLRNAHWGRAPVYHRLKRHADADREWDRVMALEEEKLRPYYRMQRALHLARAGEIAAALKTADEWPTEQDLEEEDYFDLACIYALAAADLASGGAESAGSSELREKHVARAIEFLNQAKEHGYFNKPSRIKQLETIADLAALRDRAEFQARLDALRGE